MDLRVVGLRIKTGTVGAGTENYRREPCEPHPEECKCSPASDGAAENEKKLRTIYGEKHSRFQELEALIQEKNDTREILTNFITKMEDLTGKQTEFREELWGGLVDHIRIDEKGSTVVFRGD